MFEVKEYSINIKKPELTNGDIVHYVGHNYEGYGIISGERLVYLVIKYNDGAWSRAKCSDSLSSVSNGNYRILSDKEFSFAFNLIS